MSTASGTFADSAPVGRARDALRQGSLAGGVIAVCLLSGFFLVNVPLVIVAAAGACAVCVLVARLPLAVVVLSASFYFDGYLSRGSDILTLGKAIGLLAALALLFAWVSRKQSIYSDRSFWMLAGLAAVVLLSMAIAQDFPQAALVSSRYFMFIFLYVVVIQAIGASRQRLEHLVTAVVLASAVSACIGLSNFLAGTVDRTSGPLPDPNDFGFVLASTVPLAIFKIRWTSAAPRRVIWQLVLFVILAAILTTLSRGAGVALLAAALWALATGRIRVRRIVLLAIAVVACAAGIYLSRPELIDNALAKKSHVASANIESRLVNWRVGVDEFLDHPLLGVGPGNFQVRFREYNRDVVFGKDSTVVHRDPTTTHNAYLHVLAELGIAGFLFFVGFVGMSWRRVRTRFEDPRVDELQTAIAGGFLVALVGALFLTEQFYAPMWLLPALGVANAKCSRQTLPPERN